MVLVVVMIGENGWDSALRIDVEPTWLAGKLDSIVGKKDESTTADLTSLRGHLGVWSSVRTVDDQSI